MLSAFDDRLHAGKKLLLDVDDVVVKFHGQRALDKISFCVHEGEFIGIIGPNGAGKTSLIRAMLGLQELDGGTIKRYPGTKIGYVPQRGAVQGGQVPMSVAEIVGLGTPKAAEIAISLSEVGLSELAGKRFSELSGGQQQRVLIAKALASQPSLLMLDEPTTGIDESAQRDFFAILEDLVKRRITIVMVSHDVEAVMAQVSRIICLNRSLLYDGVPNKFELEAHMPGMYGTEHRALHHRHQAGAQTGGQR